MSIENNAFEGIESFASVFFGMERFIEGVETHADDVAVIAARFT